MLYPHTHFSIPFIVPFIIKLNYKTNYKNIDICNNYIFKKHNNRKVGVGGKPLTFAFNLLSDSFINIIILVIF